MSFPELVQNLELFDKLALGDNAARAEFVKRKNIADLEFLDSSVNDVAQSLKDDWLQCPFCSDAWEAQTMDAMAKCPSCQRVSRNPNYMEV